VSRHLEGSANRCRRSCAPAIRRLRRGGGVFVAWLPVAVHNGSCSGDAREHVGC
jgi:hypothetical protein